MFGRWFTRLTVPNVYVRGRSTEDSCSCRSISNKAATKSTRPALTGCLPDALNSAPRTGKTDLAYPL